MAICKSLFPPFVMKSKQSNLLVFFQIWKRYTIANLPMIVLFMRVRNKETVKGEKRYLAGGHDFSN